MTARDIAPPATSSSTMFLAEAAPACLRLTRSQYWPVERLEALARRRLARTLRDAAKLGFYRSLWGGVPGVHEWEALSVLTRARVPELLECARQLVRGRVQSDRSSGSTGMPAEFLFDASHQRGRFAARARYLLSNGWTPWSPSAWIISMPRGAANARLIRSRIFAGSKFLSVFAPPEDQIAWLRRLDPHFVYTLPSNLEALLDVLEARGGSLPTLRRVFSGGEVLEPPPRARTRRVLGVDVSENHGTSEAFPAWECPQGGLHVNTEHVRVEIVGSSGRAKPAGRLGRVAGRSISMFRACDGRIVTPWELVVRIKYRNDLKQFQLVQRAPDLCVLRYTAPSPLGGGAEAAVVREFRAVLGPSLAVEFERVSSIERSPSGKYLTAYSEIAEGVPA